MTRVEKGRRSEDVAVAFLEKRGMKIVGRNVQCLKMGEIDVIADDNGTTVFVEVKSSYSGDMVRPQEKVNKKKQAQLTKLAQWYLKTHGLLYRSARFDVVAITWTSGGPDIKYIPYAFEATR